MGREPSEHEDVIAMFRKILRFINGGDSRSHSEPMGQLDYWDGRGTVPLTEADMWHEGLVTPNGHGFDGRWGA